MEVSLLANGAAFEHGAAFGLALLIAFLISSLTQVTKDKERFCVRDFDERIELEKIKAKIMLKRQAAGKGPESVMGDTESVMTQRGGGAGELGGNAMVIGGGVRGEIQSNIDPEEVNQSKV